MLVFIILYSNNNISIKYSNKYKIYIQYCLKVDTKFSKIIRIIFSISAFLSARKVSVCHGVKIFFSIE